MAKNVFQAYWVEPETGEIKNVQIKRAKFLEHFVNRAPCVLGMEACGGAQHWARELIKLGHEVVVLPAKSVKASPRVRIVVASIEPRTRGRR